MCQSTHLYGRRLVLEWAQAEESVEEIRKRTAKRYYQGNLFLMSTSINIMINQFAYRYAIKNFMILRKNFFFSESSTKKFKKSTLDPESVGLESNSADI